MRRMSMQASYTALSRGKYDTFVQLPNKTWGLVEWYPAIHKRPSTGAARKAETLIDEERIIEDSLTAEPRW